MFVCCHISDKQNAATSWLEQPGSCLMGLASTDLKQCSHATSAACTRACLWPRSHVCVLFCDTHTSCVLICTCIALCLVSTLGSVYVHCVDIMSHIVVHMTSCILCVFIVHAYGSHSFRVHNSIVWTCAYTSCSIQFVLCVHSHFHAHMLHALLMHICICASSVHACAFVHCMVHQCIATHELINNAHNAYDINREHT